MTCYDRETVPVESVLCRLDKRSSIARQSASTSTMAWRPLALRMKGVYSETRGQHRPPRA